MQSNRQCAHPVNNDRLERPPPQAFPAHPPDC
jgi:hypothetical protein